MKAAMVAVALLAAGLFAQRPPADSSSSARRGVSQQSGNIKMVVRQVVVDVVVTGPKGRPVKGLRKKDFEVLEDGKPQQIRAFNAHQSLDLSHVALPQMPRLPPDTFMNFSHVPSDSSLNIILLDLGNTPWDDLHFVRQQIGKFLRQRRIESRYAVFVMGSGHVSMVQGFTSDKDRLLAAINSKTTSSLLFQTTASPFGRGLGLVNAYGPSGSGVQGAADNDEFAREQGLATAAMPGGPATPPAPTSPVAAKGTRAQHILQIVAGEKGPEPSSYMKAAGTEVANNIQVDNTVAELDHLAAILSGLPGRKNLFWFTGSFPFHFQNLLMVSASQGTVVNLNNAPAVYRAARRLEASRTCVYAIDTKGIQVSIPRSEPRKVIHNNAGRRLYAEHRVLDEMAIQTGGRAFYSTNGFARVLATAANDGANYYTLAYSPGDTDFHGELRHIRVKLRKGRAKYHLHYRRSYFANSYDATAWHPPDPLAFALQHGAPDAHQILFMASLEAVGKPRPATPAEIKALTPPNRSAHQAGKGKSGKHHPLILQAYVIHYGLLPKAVTVVKEPDGSRRAELDFAVRAYGKRGNELASFDSRTQGKISRRTYQQIERNGYRVDESIVVPAKSGYLRLAVLDRLANRVGSMEVSLPLHSASKGAAPHAIRNAN